MGNEFEMQNRVDRPPAYEQDSDTEQGGCSKCGSGVQTRVRESRGIVWCLAIVVAIMAILVVILVPLSFSGLEYFEYGFRRRTTTGSVDSKQVYGYGGRHGIGPDYEFKVFPSDAHFESFQRITVFTADRLQLSISCYFQYFLRKHQLPLLHKKFDLHYRPVLRNNAKDALKGAATGFTTREYIRQREKIEQRLFKAVRERLGGTCCEHKCGTKGYMPCVPGCKEKCIEDDFGLFAEVRYFQLSTLDIPDELNQRYLQALVLQEATETEKLLQEAQIIRQETTAMVKQTENRAAEIRQNATAQHDLILARAEADSQAVLEHARADGLRHLYSQLRITNSDQRSSFDYLRTLRANKKIKLNINFDTLVAGPLKLT